MDGAWRGFNVFFFTPGLAAAVGQAPSTPARGNDRMARDVAIGLVAGRPDGATVHVS